MSTVLENTAPFKTVLGHASVLGEDGQAMHKSLGNAIEFNEGADKIGVDVMRWMFLAQNPEQNLLFGYQQANETRRHFHLLLWNVYNFFVTYANLDKWQPSSAKKKSANNLDKWVLSELNLLLKKTTQSLEDFNAHQAVLAIDKFVVDLSQWYLRRSRNRIGPDFYQTLYEVLVTLSQILAPFNPFLAEEIFRNLTEKESVHLEDWPKAEEKLIDKRLSERMTLLRQISEGGHAQRKKEGIKVRQPLKKLTVNREIKPEEKTILKEELNVKEVMVKESKGGLKVELDTQITPELQAEGEARELVRQIQDLRKETGCRLDQKIKVSGPAWPKDKKLQDYIKKETLTTDLLSGSVLKIIK